MVKSSTIGTAAERALHVYRLMLLSRLTDEKMAKLAKQNKGGTFQLSSAGHELIGVVSAQKLQPGKDWGLPYYRDQGFALGIGADLIELFGVFMGRATHNHSSGRMMPYHYSHKELRLFCQSSVVGSQFLHGAGRALAIKNLGLDEVVYVSAGDGATSQGDFHEALNFSSIHKLPVIFVIQNNGLAISVTAEEQTAGGSLASVCRGYAGLSVHDIDGTDYTAVSLAMEESVNKGRAGQGPSVIFAHVPRLHSHSNSDDQKKYKTEERLAEDKRRDPLLRFEAWLLAENLAREEKLSEVRRLAQEEVETAARKAEEIPFPEKGSSRLHLFKPFELSSPLSTNSMPAGEGERIVMAEALNHALDEEMSLDPHLLVFGQDVAHSKGGVFGVTRGLTEKYGRNRCFNTPLAESTIIGIAIGLSADGIHRAVAEIQFSDYIWTGINQLFNEAASIHYRSNGQWEVPIVVRMAYGGYIQGGPYHSQCIEGFLTHCPGLKVVIPSNAADAKGLLKTAIRDPNPVLFLEHKALYRQQKFAARPEPPKDHMIPFGQASIVREGSDITIITWGQMVLMAVEVADKLALEGISVEILDLRTLIPLDMTAILASVRKTGKVIVTHEAPLTGGFGGEIVARIASEAFAYLDGPITRVGGFDSPIPYSKPLENEVLPQPQDIRNAILELMRY